MFSRLIKLSLLSSLLAVAGCSDPKRKLIGQALSPDGKLALTLYHEVPGSIIDDTMVLTIAASDAPFSANASVAGIKTATNLRAYWTAEGRPVLSAQSLNGWVTSEPSRSSLRVCVGADVDCANLGPPVSKIELENYRSAESG